MRIIAALAVAVAVTTAAVPSSQAHDAYTMEDLEALLKQQSWGEILEHALDIRPARRNDRWKTILQTAAIGHINAIRATGNRARAMDTAEELLIKHPLLKGLPKYMDTRATAGLEAMEACFSNSRMSVECSERMEVFVAADDGNHRLAFEAGKLTRLRGSTYTAARIFAVAFKNPERRKDCGDPQVALAVRGSLTNFRHAPTIAAAKQVAFEYCFDALKDDLMDAFKEGGRFFLKSTCPELNRRKLLSPFQQALCEDAQS